MIKNKKYFLFLVELLKHKKNMQILGLIITFSYSILVYLGPIISQYLVDVIIPKASIKDLNSTLFFFMAVLLLQPLLLFLQNNIYLKISESITADLRKRIFENILYKDMEFYFNNTRGEIISRTLNDTRIIGDFVSNILAITVKNFLLTLSILIGMIKINSLITSIIFMMMLSLLLPAKFFNRRIRKLSKIRQESYDDLSTDLNDVLSNIINIKVFALFDYFCKKYNELLKLNQKNNIKIQKNNYFLNNTLEFINLLCLLVIYYIGFNKLLNNKITLGQVMALSLYFQTLINPLMGLLNCNINFQMVVPIIDRINHYLKVNLAVNEKNVLMCEKIQEIEIRNLRYGYGENLIFNNFNCRISGDDLTCICGVSGIGKSTLANLLLGIINPLSGEILIDNKPTTKILNGKILLVPQENTLFHMSVMDNIRLGDTGISEHLIYAICKKVNIYNDIIKLDRGFETLMSDQTNISVGQAQRILLVRTLVRKPAAIILDEPTAALDSTNRDNIIALLHEISKQCMVIVITHDQLLINSADNVINLTP